MLAPQNKMIDKRKMVSFQKNINICHNIIVFSSRNFLENNALSFTNSKVLTMFPSIYPITLNDEVKFRTLLYFREHKKHLMKVQLSKVNK